eukprot:1137682-Pelagomonas_calceolata.AAC.3
MKQGMHTSLFGRHSFASPSSVSLRPMRSLPLGHMSRHHTLVALPPSGLTANLAAVGVQPKPGVA